MHVSFHYANLNRQMYVIWNFFILFFLYESVFFTYKVASLEGKVIVVKGSVEVDLNKAETSL